MQGLSSILSLFCNEFDKFNKTGAQMLESIYHMSFRLFCNHVFSVKKCKDFARYMQRYWRHFITVPKSVIH